MNEIVFDRVPWPQQHRVFESRQRVHEIRLQFARQRHRKTVHINLPRVDAFGLEENLVPLLVREAHDLVLERRAVARTDAANLPVEEGRAIDVRPNEIAHAIVGVQQIAIDLWTVDAGRGRREK